MKRLFAVLSVLIALSLACARSGIAPAPTPTIVPTTEVAPTKMPLIIPVTRAAPTSAPTVAPSTPVPLPTDALAPEPTAKAVVLTSVGWSMQGVTYCTMDNVALKMDVYFPNFPLDPNQSLPALVYVHGGGWAAGDRHQGAGLAEVPGLLDSGFVVFSIDYRLAPKYRFPTMINDVKCAIRSIRAHAGDYTIDPNRIGAWGGSAGGHLVALLGTSDESAGFDVGEYLDYSSRVQAVVDLFGPADLTLPFTPEQQQIASFVFSPDQLEMASPVTYISPDDPPFLIEQGDQDQLVPLEQSQILYDRLTAAGVPATLVVVKNAGHGFVPVGGPIDPNRDQLTQMIVDFFVQHLK